MNRVSDERLALLIGEFHTVEARMVGEDCRDCRAALKAAEERARAQAVATEVQIRHGLKLYDQIDELKRERDEARAECSEQARLNGMGAEREAKLIAERDAARFSLQALDGERIRDNEYLIRERDAAIQRAEKAETALSKSQPIKLAEHASDCSCSFCKR